MEHRLLDDELNFIRKSIEGDATKEEIAWIGDWLQKSEENRKLYLQMKNIWEVSARQLKPEDVNAEGALKKVFQAISGKGIKRTSWRIFQRIAAAILIPLAVAAYVLGRNVSANTTRNNRHETYREVFTPYGTRTHLSLSDGSSVWLNAGSILRYPDAFDRDRRVFLEGEAYFEVRSDARRPFIVETRTISVEATGTAFDILASAAEPDIEVTLIEGKVAVNNMDDRDNPVPVINLEPGQHFTYDTLTRDYQLESQDPYRYISWKDGLMIFRNDPLADVVKKIGNHYNVDIELQDKELESIRYRATFENESFEEIMKLLKLSSPIDYMEQERSALPDGTFTKRKVIIFAKN